MSVRRATLVLLLIGCGGTAPAPRAPEAEGERAESIEQPAPDVRALGSDASFAGLLDAARILDDRRDQGSTAGCLLRRGWRLEADLAVAVRPLPTPPEDLDDALARHAGPVNVLSRWGAYGPGEPSAPSFAAVTSTLPPRREPALVWALTDEGVYVRSSQTPSEVDPVAIEATPAPGDGVGALFVTAEAGTSLERLARLLERAPASLAGRIGLAVALAPGTRLPAPPEQAEVDDPDAGRCPDGLPAPPEDAAFGDLPPEAIVERLGPLRDAAEICVSASQGPGAAGGRIELAMRIGANGIVAEACAVEDATGDPALRACLLRAAETLAFPPPSPEGVVDVQLPLVLAPVASQRQMPLCR